MDEPMSDFHFRLMAFSHRFRDIFFPRMNILKEVGINPGFQVLDYGCGAGSYIIAATELVGKSGRIYALDISPLAIEMVRNIASKEQLTNVETICSDCKTGLPNNSVDVVLLYDTFHSLGDPSRVLEELHRILKASGILSFSDHHMSENEIVSKVTNRGLFRLLKKGKKTYRFVKEE
ncbi:MAG: class I SAM-dependent methyltransferase [Deltaproteobacteria bacterium]|jgi:ubiquinone/menaquinone biosynthesis C-methylase UbiE|nr:MAG: class I SAM-dependent methyltransferase [Deltaproteobacteria bacterium]